MPGLSPAAVQQRLMALQALGMAEAQGPANMRQGIREGFSGIQRGLEQRNENQRRQMEIQAQQEFAQRQAQQQQDWREEMQRNRDTMTRHRDQVQFGRENIRNQFNQRQAATDRTNRGEGMITAMGGLGMETGGFTPESAANLPPSVLSTFAANQRATARDEASIAAAEAERAFKAKESERDRTAADMQWSMDQDFKQQQQDRYAAKDAAAEANRKADNIRADEAAAFRQKQHRANVSADVLKTRRARETAQRDKDTRARNDLKAELRKLRMSPAYNDEQRKLRSKREDGDAVTDADTIYERAEEELLYEISLIEDDHRSVIRNGSDNGLSEPTADEIKRAEADGWRWTGTGFVR